MGWAVDDPTFISPDGSAFQGRLTFVMRQEDRRWKLVHAHFSVGVPDDEVVELQRRWSEP
jgi:ketosteroid isomerase-like protein